MNKCWFFRCYRLPHGWGLGCDFAWRLLKGWFPGRVVAVHFTS